jgi:hypothetical protein
LIAARNEVKFLPKTFSILGAEYPDEKIEFLIIDAKVRIKLEKLYQLSVRACE